MKGKVKNMLTQISIFLENRSGQLVQITEILSQNNVNIRAINIAETSDYGILRLVADDSEKAYSALIENGFVATRAEIVAAAVPDSVGGLNRLLVAIAEENIDIDYMYSIFGKSDGMAYMIFKVADPAALTKTLLDKGFTVDDGKAIGIK